MLEPRDGVPAVVDTPDALDRAVAALAAGDGPVAVDAERASGYRYGQRAYLVQFRRKGAGTVLIDPIACPDLSSLDAAVADTEAVLHAASQDLPCLAELGYRPRRLFDTELAGRLLGFPRVGLGALVEHVLGLHLEKGYAAADWSTRPLPRRWLRYAALDVEVLIELRDALVDMLTAAGKLEWARQEFTAVLATRPPAANPHPWRRTSGIHRVRSRGGLAVVRELWQEREEIAQERDLSPRRVLPDTAIVAAALAFPAGDAETTPVGLHDLARLPGFDGRVARQYARRWLAAMRRAHAVPAADRPASTTVTNDGPPPPSRWGEQAPVAAARLRAARDLVASLASAHTVPAENLLPPDAVRRLAWEPPDRLDAATVAAALAGHGARPWQIALTAEPLAAALRGARP